MAYVLEVTEGMETEAVEGNHRRLEVAECQRDNGAADEVRNARAEYPVFGRIFGLPRIQ